MDFFAAQDHARKQTRKLVIYFVLAVVAIVLSIYAVVVVLFGQIQGFSSGGDSAQGGYGYSQSGGSYGSGSYGSGSGYGSTSGNRYSGNSTSGSSASGDGGFTVQTDIQWWNPALFGLVSVSVLAVILGAAGLKTLELRSGGGVVARSLGGVRVEHDTRNANERRLLNVVEEMALASGTPIPEVYILKGEEGINAFAAGHSVNDAAIAVTEGCLNDLSRDELQGVIAHEFSHILNGDMRMNLRLIGVLFGILVLSVLGELVMRSAALSGGARRRDNNNNGAAAFLILGIALMAIGYIGVFFGRLIQSAISRQREFLADASAVQFTRYPDGIANALIKIGSQGSALQSPHAQETAHLFFANGLKSGFGGALATHPPLDQRVRAIKADWNGEFTVAKSSAAAAARGEAEAAKGKKPRTSLSAQDAMAAIGTLGMASIASAQALRSRALTVLGDAPLSLNDAKALVLALLIQESAEADRRAHLDWLKQRLEPEVWSRMGDYSKRLAATGEIEMLAIPLIELAMPALGTLDAQGLKIFTQKVRTLAEADSHLSFNELAVLALVHHRLVAKATGAASAARVSGDAARLAPAFSTVLSAIVRASVAEAAQSTGSASGAGANTAGGNIAGAGAVSRGSLASVGTSVGTPIGASASASAASAADGVTALSAEALFGESLAKAPLFSALASLRNPQAADLLPAFEALSHAAPALKSQVMAAATEAIVHDGKVTPREGEWLRLVAACLDCPMPPIPVSA